MEEDLCVVPPFRFGRVNPDLTRGAYPTLPNFRFLRRLRLKRIVSLTPEPPVEDLVNFAEAHEIKIVHISVPQNAPLNTGLQQQLIQALHVIINSDNLPAYVHCIDGRRITGTLVLLLRKLQGWSSLSFLTEYWRYQMSDRSQMISGIEIEKLSRDLEKFANEFASEIFVPHRIPKWLWAGDKTVQISGIKTRMESGAAIAESELSRSKSQI